MLRRPPRSTRTDTLFPHTTLFRSQTRLSAYSAATGPRFNVACRLPARHLRRRALRRGFRDGQCHWLRCAQARRGRLHPRPCIEGGWCTEESKTVGCAHFRSRLERLCGDCYRCPLSPPWHPCRIFGPVHQHSLRTLGQGGTRSEVHTSEV